jgi:hypothetical protein
MFDTTKLKYLTVVALSYAPREAVVVRVEGL